MIGPVDPTSPITDSTVIRRRVTVSPLLLATCLAAQPGAADDGIVEIGIVEDGRIDVFEK